MLLRRAHHVSSFRHRSSAPCLVVGRSTFFAGCRPGNHAAGAGRANASRHRRDAEPLHPLDRAVPGYELVALRKRADDACRLCPADAHNGLQRCVCQHAAAGTAPECGLPQQLLRRRGLVGSSLDRGLRPDRQPAVPGDRELDLHRHDGRVGLHLRRRHLVEQGPRVQKRDRQ